MAAAEKASASCAARSRLSWAGHGGSRRARYEVTGSASIVAALTRTRPAVTGSQLSGANSRAANGGYVNRRPKANRSWYSGVPCCTAAPPAA